MTQDGSSEDRRAWQKLYSGHGLQYGGSGDLGPLEAHLRRGMLVLDAGCGDGKTAEALSSRCDVVACDFSREALHAFLAQRIIMDGLYLVECDMRNLPFEQERFHAATLVHSISHLLRGDRERVAQEVARVTMQDGIVYAEVFSVGDIRMGEGERLEESTFLRGNGILTHYFRRAEILSMFPGFRVLSEAELVRRVSFGAVAGRRSLLRVLIQKHGD